MILRSMPERASNDQPHPLRSAGAGALLLAAIAGAFAACTSTPTPKPPPPLPERTPIAAPVRGSAVAVDLRPMGFVPTDGVTLPLLSPSGRFMAAQTGVAPDLATALARRGQRPPLASRIAIYRIDPRGLVRLGETDGGLILGRAADDRGFLVESVRPDGARWIGRVDWGTRETEWLVQDAKVNAFATLGPGGLLAYSARAIADRNFDLVVRGGEGEPRTLAGEGVRSFILPCFSEDGSRLLCMALRDGILELAAADPASSESLSQSLSRFFLTDRGGDELALFMASAQGVRDGVDGRSWLLFHKPAGSLVRWTDGEGLRVIPGSVLASGRIDAGREAVLSGTTVRVRPRGADDADAAAEPGTVVLDQLGVPRALGMVEDKPAFLIFAPEPNGVRIVIARLVG